MMHLSTGKPAPREWIEFELCDRLGWTLDYVRGLPLPQIMQLRTMMVAEGKVKKALSHG